MKNKKRPAYIEKQLKEVNDFFRSNKVKDDYNNPLFWWWCNYLSENGWYRGWNMHVDKEIETSEGVKIVRALTGPYNKMDEYTKKNYYNQIW